MNKENKERKSNAGAKTKFHEKMLDQVFEMALLGLTDVQMAKVLGICDATFDNYKNDYPLFLGSLTRGKAEADGKVARAMYNRAIGVIIKEEALTRDGEVVTLHKELPSDTAAAKHWLSNRQRALWANNGENTITTTTPLVITLDKSELNSEADSSI
jgi:hypothetical protein